MNLRNAALWVAGPTALVLSFAAEASAPYPAPTPYPLTLPAGIPQPPVAADIPLTVQGVALGKRLFFDVRLSGDNTQSCASCHRIDTAFSDAGKATSTGIDKKNGTRNTPGLFNVAFFRNQFWDGRSPTLRDQALLPIQNPVEMHNTLPIVLRRMQSDKSYLSMFAQAFGSPGITTDRIGRAIEQYETTLLSGDSRFDTNSLTAQEERGRVLFFNPPVGPGRPQTGAGCVRCHGGPTFSDAGFHNIGLDVVSADTGRAGVTGLTGDQGAFKTPSLRNIALTGPYMHDGRFATLEQVVQHYSDGIQPAATLDPGLARQNGGVRLSVAQQADLVAFMRALTDSKLATRGSP
jgi:cytochrome c peroxidase